VQNSNVITARGKTLTSRKSIRQQHSVVFMCDTNSDRPTGSALVSMRISLLVYGIRLMASMKGIDWRINHALNRKTETLNKYRYAVNSLVCLQQQTVYSAQQHSIMLSALYAIARPSVCPSRCDRRPYCTYGKRPYRSQSVA